MKDKGDEIYLREKEKWLKKIYGEYEEEKIGECTMPGCRGTIYEDMEYFEDDSGNIFCSVDCVCQWYGIRKGTKVGSVIPSFGSEARTAQV